MKKVYNGNANKKQNQSQSKQLKVPRAVSFGRVDFNFILNLPEEILPFYNLTWEKLNDISDLAFLKETKELWDSIQLISNNSLTNILMFINKAHNIKSFVEMTLFKELQFEEKENFLKEIITHVTEHNYLFLIELNMMECKHNITFTVKCDKKTKTFDICKGSEEEREKEEGIPIENQIEKAEGSKSQASKTEEDPFRKLNIDFSEFDFLIVDLEEIFHFLPQNPKILKQFTNFLQKKIMKNKNLKLVVNYPDVMKSLESVDLETINVLTEIISSSDILIFEKKQALSLFNMLHRIGVGSDILTGSSSGFIDEKELHNYFAYGLKFSRSGPKVGLFLNDFQKFQVVEVTKGKIDFNTEYDCQLHPKINHTNQKLISEYKNLIYSNFSMLKSVFLGGFLSRIVTSNKKLSKEYYSAYLAGCETSKRILEIYKNYLDLPLEHDFYIVKIPQIKIDKELEKEELRRREQRFVLDCVNRNNSHIKYYNPLFDDHLNSFFASESVRKQLKEKGFINTNGFIMYDPNYRAVMGSSPKRKLSNDREKEKQLLYAIRNINVADDPRDKTHFDSYSKMLHSNSPTNRKLPSVHFEYNSMSKTSNFKGGVFGKKKLKPINTASAGKIYISTNYRLA